MAHHLLKATVNVLKQGKEHHEQMVEWCREFIGTSNFQWFGYDVGAHKTTLFHFYSEEAATAFVFRWGGRANTAKSE